MPETSGASASAGVDYPEQLWNGGFGPRIGLAYALNDKTVIRTGYGIFYTQAFYPGWGGGVDQDGFNSSPSLNTTGLGGLDPAFYWQNGFPIDKVLQPPFIDSGFLNGQGGPNYRPTDGNKLSYSQQWNFTIERQLPKNMMVSVAYVGNKGTRLPSQLSPINVLNPNLLSQYGNDLTKQFSGEGQTVAGVAEPYAGWYTQMHNYGCTPTVAQALTPYPQYCGSLTGLNENLGSSTYNAFQLKWEKRMSEGLYALVSYNHSKIITSAAGLTQSTSATWNGSTSVYSPYQQSRNKSLASDDVPNSFSAALVVSTSVRQGQEVPECGRSQQLVPRRMGDHQRDQTLVWNSLLVPIQSMRCSGTVPGVLHPDRPEWRGPVCHSGGQLRPRHARVVVQFGVVRAGEQLHRLSTTGASDRASATTAAKATRT